MSALHRLLSIAALAALAPTLACGSVVRSDSVSGSSSGTGGAAGQGASGGATTQGGSQGGSGATATSQGGSGGGGSGQGGSGGGGSGGASTGTPCGCSGDLQSVVDCDGTPLEKCGPDKGCAGAACVDDPCLAASLAQTSTGCDYWALETSLLKVAAGACFAVAISSAWPSPAHITVSYGGVDLDVASFTRIVVREAGTTKYLPYDSAQGLPPGETAVLFLSDGPGNMTLCPVAPALSADPGFQGTGRGEAFHVTTDSPVSAAQMLPYWASDGLASAALLLPASAWKNDYLAIDAYANNAPFPGSPSLDIVAREDGTDVTLVSKVPVDAAPGVEGTAAGLPKVYTLNRGEYLQITQAAELTGSTIHASKPVGVIGASGCMSVPIGVESCDSGQQQLPPVQAMGHEHVAVRYSSREPGQEEHTRFRLIGARNGTALTWEPAPPPGAPASLDLGQVVEIDTPGPFVVRSQDQDHPFYLGAYMTGGAAFNKGDPDWVNVVPTEQYLRSYDFFANPDFADDEIVVVRAPDKTGAFAEVTLDCAGALAGWKPIGAYQYVRVPLGKAHQDVAPCTTGQHHIGSSAPFAVTVWGIGDIIEGSSSAIPAGTGLAGLNGIVFPQ